MFSGTNVVLVTNHEEMIEQLSSELVQLRNIDSILIRSYENVLPTIESEKPQAIIINCQSTIEEPICLDMIQKMKKITSVPIILVVESYDREFIRNANKIGISDVVSLKYGNSEILMRTIWSLQKTELRQQQKKHEKLLIQLNALNVETQFYTAKYSNKVFQNEIDYFKDTKIDGIFLAIAPNKDSRLKPSTQNIIDTIKSNVRLTDTVAHTKSQNTFYLLLSNTNLKGAMVVWNRINNNIGADETLCGCIYELESDSYEEIEGILKDGLKQAQKSPSYLYIVESKLNDDENWLEDGSMPGSKTRKNFKLFQQIFLRKKENVIKPTINDLLDEYKEILSNTEVKVDDADDSFTIDFINKRQESQFKMTQRGNSIFVKTTHNGLDSPENNEFILGLNEIKRDEVINCFEDFILEFKSCI